MIKFSYEVSEETGCAGGQFYGESPKVTPLEIAAMRAALQNGHNIVKMFEEMPKKH